MSPHDSKQHHQVGSHCSEHEPVGEHSYSVHRKLARKTQGSFTRKEGRAHPWKMKITHKCMQWDLRTLQFKVIGQLRSMNISSNMSWYDEYHDILLVVSHCSWRLGCSRPRTQQVQCLVRSLHFDHIDRSQPPQVVEGTKQLSGPHYRISHGQNSVYDLTTSQRS